MLEKKFEDSISYVVYTKWFKLQNQVNLPDVVIFYYTCSYRDIGGANMYKQIYCALAAVLFSTSITVHAEEIDNSHVKTEITQQAETDIPFKLGQEINSPSFTGTVYIESMVQNDETYHFPATNHITFEPKSRSGWHSHGGMILLVTGGIGYYQEQGKPAQILRKGDVVNIEPGVKHWHGAAPDSWFSQIVIFDSSYIPEENVSEEVVTDEEYQNLNAEEYSERTVTPDNEFMFERARTAMNSDTFTGPVYVSSLIGADNAAGAPELHYVVFDPGVINNWHTHEGGQILIATDGIGYHQIEGESVQILYPGEVAFCPPGAKHWHGGSADTSFAHIAVNTNPDLTGLEWFDRISEEEYDALTKRFKLQN